MVDNYNVTSISFQKMLGLRFAHTKKNVKADFNSLGFFRCKSLLNQLNSKMKRMNWSGLNEILSK